MTPRILCATRFLSMAVPDEQPRMMFSPSKRTTDGVIRACWLTITVVRSKGRPAVSTPIALSCLAQLPRPQKQQLQARRSHR